MVMVENIVGCSRSHLCVLWLVHKLLTSIWKVTTLSAVLVLYDWYEFPDFFGFVTVFNELYLEEYLELDQNQIL